MKNYSAIIKHFTDMGGIKMATLYEINQDILDCIDLETGEVFDLDKLQNLQMEKNEKIENIALLIKNLKSDIEAYKSEKEVFAKKQQQAMNKMEWLKQYLTDNLKGEKFNTSKVNISYRKSEVINIDNDERFIARAERLGEDDLLTYKTPVINKTKVKEKLKSGWTFEGVSLIEKQNIQIK